LAHKEVPKDLLDGGRFGVDHRGERVSTDTYGVHDDIP
jgi:hypothetical protein